MKRNMNSFSLVAALAVLFSCAPAKAGDAGNALQNITRQDAAESAAPPSVNPMNSSNDEYAVYDHSTLMFSPHKDGLYDWNQKHTRDGMKFMFRQEGTQPPATSKREFCAKASPAYFKSLAYDSNNFIAFPNQRGTGGQRGLCSRFSLFQRSALYLTIYRPDLPKPNSRDALTIIKRIISNNYVTAVPGYNNLGEFTTDWKDLLVNYMSEWVDRAYFFGWDAPDSLEYSPQKMKAMMDKIYEETAVRRNITYVAVSEKKFSHALLVLEMRRAWDGYFMRFIDSNAPQAIRYYHYAEGDTVTALLTEPTIIYYPEVEAGALRQIKHTIQEFCYGSGPSELLDIYPDRNAGNFPHGTAKPSPNYK